MTQEFRRRWPQVMGVETCAHWHFEGGGRATGNSRRISDFQVGTRRHSICTSGRVAPAAKLDIATWSIAAKGVQSLQAS